MADIILVPGNITREQRRSTKDFRALIDETNRPKYNDKRPIDIGTPVKIYSLGVETLEKRAFDKKIEDINVVKTNSSTPNALIYAIYSTRNIIANVYD